MLTRPSFEKHALLLQKSTFPRIDEACAVRCCDMLCVYVTHFVVVRDTGEGAARLDHGDVWARVCVCVFHVCVCVRERARACVAVCVFVFARECV